jgi:DNA repair protein RAD5
MSAPTEPAPKKRRFFRDDLDDYTHTVMTREITPPLPPSLLNPPMSVQPRQTVEEDPSFSEQLLAIIGEELSAKTIQSLQDVSGGNLERAVNMYFDGSWSQQQQVREQPPLGLITTSPAEKPAAPTLNSFVTRYVTRPDNPRKHTPTPSPPGPWSRKYIGSLGVEGWAIASGTNLVKAGDPLIIERQNPKSATSKSSSNKVSQTSIKTKLAAPPSRFPIQSKQGKQHMLVRFTTMSGREIGRLPQETANFVSTLLDQEICGFDGVCIFAPDRIRTGDNILIQLRCYLLPKVFKAITSSKEDRPGVWEVSETEEERALKLRRVGLLQLFSKIGLEPIRSNNLTGRGTGAREQLLMAAQLPEPKPPGMSRSSSSQSSPPSDGEGEEVAEDTLNLLYKKAQMYDPDMPTMDPPDTFKFELRKYQKQALCWMVGKESGGENEIRKQQSLNPLWEEYQWPRDDTVTTERENVNATEQSDDDKFYLNPYSGEMSLDLPTYESIQKGGLLADGTKVLAVKI